MGLLAAIKKMFSSNIIYNPNDDTDLGVLVGGGKQKLKVGSAIVLEDNATLVLVYKNQIMDYLYNKGKYKVDRHTMPLLLDAASTKRDPEPKKISAKIYALKSGEVAKFAFQSERAFVIRSREYGKSVGQVEGLCTIAITDPKALMDWLFKIRRSYREGEIDYMVSKQIGDTICLALERSRLDIKDVVLKNLNINEYLDDDLAEGFEAIGFKIKDIMIKGMEFDKKTQEKVDAIISREYEKIDKTETKYVTITTRGDDNNMVSYRGGNPDEIVVGRDDRKKICPHCGQSVMQAFEYCPHCGRKI